MERESFEDEEVAALLNEHFVSIKVDREERPDIDHIYMRFCQVVTGQGGWPLTIVMTPDQEPFYAATYLPKNRRYGRAGLMELLPKIGDQWNAKQGELTAWSQRVIAEMNAAFQRPMEGQPGPEWVKEAVEQLVSSADPEYGGFGEAPKFPSPHNLMFLLRQGVLASQPELIELACNALNGMRQGGIYDHVGGGFSRYSTDERWLVPHFEKMLYDNALLIMAYAEAYQITHNPLYAQTVEAIIRYLLRDMHLPEGAFTSAEDADSEGEEGLFYTWTPEEVKRVLGEEDGTWYCSQFGITPAGNFEGRNIPNLIGNLDLLDSEANCHRADSCHERLLSTRSQRVRPHRDDKVLTAWNGLMMAAVAVASRALTNAEYAQASEAVWNFIATRLRRSDGRLMARYRDGDTAYPGYLDDYAFTIWGLIELYETTYQTEYLAAALELQGQMDDLFWDDERGGYYFNGRDGEALLARPKEIYDGAMPSGNSVAAYNGIRLARLTGRMELEDRAQRIFEAFAADIGFAPSGHTFGLMAFDLAQRPSRELVLVTESDVPQEWVADLHKGFLPDTAVLVKTRRNAQDLESIAGFTEGQKMVDGLPTAYLCQNFACRQPESEWSVVWSSLTQS